ncbi:hypothetical protein AWM70_19395 [Paenibacillus yonginensis]|uniref:Uncharacterized protein n=1 Tax=Paenibacillus yonginensis TaxID=1462996 RepID=A0A1B1N4U7_9BACL|nr:hypothetical protein [Paenibacillus yonginensis]ANS76471.1 hypothetical protein AWM70_19395 [Paenibacillus yonginensis]
MSILNQNNDLETELRKEAALGAAKLENIGYPAAYDEDGFCSAAPFTSCFENEMKRGGTGRVIGNRLPDVFG